MMGREQNLVGKSFGRWEVIAFSHKHLKYGRFYLCQCKCGNQRVVRGGHLSANKTRSCGCTHIKHGDGFRDHRRLPEYMAWAQMRIRCRNTRHPAYQHYGGRGITVCERWNSYENFLADMGRKPSPEYSLDRIDNNGNYEPGNCRWATWSQQNNNQRRSSKRNKPVRSAVLSPPSPEAEGAAVPVG